MTDWNKIADVLRTQAMPTYGRDADLYVQAITLCERMAQGELVERSEVWEVARKMQNDRVYAAIGPDRKQPPQAPAPAAATFPNAPRCVSCGGPNLGAGYSVNCASCDGVSVSTSPTLAQDEREELAHCVYVAEAILNSDSLRIGTEHVQLERAAVRAEYEAKLKSAAEQNNALHQKLSEQSLYSAGLKHSVTTVKARLAEVAEERAVWRQANRELSEAHTAANAELERLRARVQELEQHSRRLNAALPDSEQCDVCDGAGRYFIDGEPQTCVCISEYE